jgi:hypothetical protein
MEEFLLGIYAEYQNEVKEATFSHLITCGLRIWARNCVLSISEQSCTQPSANLHVITHKNHFQFPLHATNFNETYF